MIKFYQSIADALILNAISAGIEVTTSLTIQRHSDSSNCDIELIVVFPNHSYGVNIVSDRIKITNTRIKRDFLGSVESVATKRIDYCLSDPEVFDMIFKYMKENDYA